MWPRQLTAIDCVPDRLYMFLNVLLGRQTLIDCDSETKVKGSATRKTLILSLAKIYAVSEGKKWTPKHIGLASTLHQLTRSKHLVELLHRAGDILSYKQVLKIDTALAEYTLQSMNRDNGAVVPPNLSSDTKPPITSTSTNSTLDGKNTFHATEVAAWQRGPAPDAQLSQLKPSSNVTLKIAEATENLYQQISTRVKHTQYLLSASRSSGTQLRRTRQKLRSKHAPSICLTL